jgi:uncharacterized short protein YbdD (DUF466 family)
MLKNLKAVGAHLKQAGRLMCGLPDYDRYVEHRREHHPDEPVMTYEEFFRERQSARYGAGNGGCRCC